MVDYEELTVYRYPCMTRMGEPACWEYYALDPESVFFLPLKKIESGYEPRVEHPSEVSVVPYNEHMAGLPKVSEPVGTWNIDKGLLGAFRDSVLSRQRIEQSLRQMERELAGSIR